MNLEERMTAMEAAYGTQSELMRELRDAVTVTASLEARHGKLLKAHGEWLASQEESLKQHRALMKELDERIANLVSGFGEFLRRQQP